MTTQDINNQSIMQSDFASPTIRCAQIAESLLDEAKVLSQGDPVYYRYWTIAFMQDMLVKISLHDPSYLKDLEEKHINTDDLPF